MFTGLRKFLNSGIRFYRSHTSATFVGLRPNQSADPATSFYLSAPSALPGSTQALTVDPAGNMGYQPLSGGGSVSSVALALPTAIFDVSGSPVTSSGTLTATLDNQAQNTFFAGAASGGAATPSFRAIAFADISALVGTTANTIAAGNDGRFHTQNTDVGTTAASFAIDSGGTGVRLKNSAGALQLRNLADSGFSDLEVANLIVRGTTTTVNSETVTIADSTLLLNSDVTGTPTENGGIAIERGTSTDATLLWDESNDVWMAGLAGSEVALTRIFRASFTNANLVAGVLTISHNLAQQWGVLQVFDNTNKQIIPDDVTLGAANSATVDLTSFGTLTGTWRVTYAA